MTIILPSFYVNRSKRCGYIKYVNLKSASLWSLPKILHSALVAHGEAEFHVIWTNQCGDMQHFLFGTKLQEVVF